MTLHWLTSYHYFEEYDMDEWVAKMYGGTPPASLFVDSGAFSVIRKGITISIPEYAAWLKRWQHLIGPAANLDVIRDAERTYQNQKAMELQGVRPIPVFHAGSPWRYLERYVEEYPFIALGGTVGAPDAVKSWLVKAFQMAEGKAVFHGFGMTQWRILRDFPFYSVDSTSWMQGYRYGSFPLFDRGRWVKVKMFTPEVWEHADLIRKHGILPSSVADRATYHHIHPFKAGMMAWHRAGEWLKQRHGEIPLEGSESGPIIYLAADSSTSAARYKAAGEVARAIQ